MCSTRAALVGGRYSNVRDNWANICWRALLTSVKGQVSEYKETTKLSKTLISSDGCVRDLSFRWQNVVVSSGLVAHLRYADFFPVPKKNNVWSHLSGHENQEEHVFLQETWHYKYRAWKYILSSCPFQMSPMISLHQSR